MRVANLPGVASHAASGGLLAWWLLPTASHGAAWPPIMLAAAAAVLLCLAGNLLNDWHDQAWDAHHRPGRALPSGHFRPSTFLVLGMCGLLAGVALMFATGMLAGMAALFIAACVAIYTRLHKRALWTVVPLALCRATLPVMAAMAVVGSLPAGGDMAWWIIVAHATALFAWTCGLSLDARGESTGDSAGPQAAPWFLLAAAPLIPLPWLQPLSQVAWIGLLPAAIWLVIVRGPLRHTAKQRVSALLAGLPLLDLLVLLPASQSTSGQPVWILWLPLVAFAIGRGLQRIAAAT